MMRLVLVFGCSEEAEARHDARGGVGGRRTQDDRRALASRQGAGVRQLPLRGAILPHAHLPLEVDRHVAEGHLSEVSATYVSPYSTRDCVPVLAFHSKPTIEASS